MSFKLQAKDIMGQAAGPLSDEWTFGVFGKVKVPHVKITDNRDGTFTCEFSLPEPGEYTLRCTLGDKHAKGSPFRLTAI